MKKFEPMHPKLSRDMLALAQRYSDHTGLALATVSNKIPGTSSKFYSGLKRGQGFNVRSYDRIVMQFAEIWPAELEWPDSVPRP